MRLWGFIPGCWAMAHLVGYLLAKARFLRRGRGVNDKEGWP